MTKDERTKYITDTRLAMEVLRKRAANGVDWYRITDMLQQLEEMLSIIEEQQIELDSLQGK